MGLRDHEFDIAPELMAALARGTPGPLLDRAMAHGTNIVEATAALRESEQNARIRDAAAAVEGVVDAALNGVDAVIGRVQDRGAFDVGIVGGEIPGGSNHLANLGLDPQSLGPGRSAGNISLGRYGSIRGSTVFDFITSLQIGGSAHVGLTPAGDTYPDTPLTPAEQNRVRIKELAGERQQLIDEQIANAQAAYARILELTEQGASESAILRARDMYLLWVSLARFNTEAQNRAIRGLNRVRYDAPDGDHSGPSISTAVEAEALFRRLESLDGLGWREQERQSRGGRAPNILHAVDPAPDSNNSISVAAEIRHWSQWLIDPIPQ